MPNGFNRRIAGRSQRTSALCNEVKMRRWPKSRRNSAPHLNQRNEPHPPFPLLANSIGRFHCWAARVGLLRRWSLCATTAILLFISLRISVLGRSFTRLLPGNDDSSSNRRPLGLSHPPISGGG